MLNSTQRGEEEHSRQSTPAHELTVQQERRSRPPLLTLLGGLFLHGQVSLDVYRGSLAERQEFLVGELLEGPDGVPGGRGVGPV